MNKINSTGGVEVIAKKIHNNCGGLIISFEPSQTSVPNILQPKQALNFKGQYIPIDFDFWLKCLNMTKLQKNILIHQPTLAGSIFSIFLSLFNKRFTIFKHARGDGLLGLMIEKLCRYIILTKSMKCIVTSRHEQKFSKLTGFCEVINFPIPKLVENPTLRLPTKEKISLVIIGRLVPYKGILQFLNELKDINDENFLYTLDIIGDGPLKNVIAERAKKLSWIKLHGNVTDEKKIEILSNSCALVVCSISKGEAFNLTQLEALSLLKPVLLRRLSSGTQDTAWKSKTVIRYRDGQLSDGIKKLSDLNQVNFIEDWKFFQLKYSNEIFFEKLVTVCSYSGKIKK